MDKFPEPRSLLAVPAHSVIDEASIASAFGVPSIFFRGLSLALAERKYYEEFLANCIPTEPLKKRL